VGIVLGECRLDQRPGPRRVHLVILLDQLDRTAFHRHGAVGGVLEAHAQPDVQLLAIGPQRAGEGVDVGDDYGLLRLGQEAGAQP